MTLVQITGLPGSGKTTGVESLNPDTTYYIDADKKGLSWVGWRKQYNQDKKNYRVTSDVPTIFNTVKLVLEKRPEINTIVIDTITSLMTDMEIEASKQPGFDKWVDMTKDIYMLYDYLRTVGRSDIVCFIMAHSELYEVDGKIYKRTKTAGKKLSKIDLNSKLNYNFYTAVEFSGNEARYKLLTNNDGTFEARSPKGMFDYEIDNNLEAIRTKIVETES